MVKTIYNFMHIGKWDLFSLSNNTNRDYHNFNFLIKKYGIFLFWLCQNKWKKKGQVSKLGKQIISFRKIIYEVWEKNLTSIKSSLQLLNVDVLSPKWKYMFWSFEEIWHVTDYHVIVFHAPAWLWDSQFWGEQQWQHQAFCLGLVL